MDVTQKEAEKICQKLNEYNNEIRNEPNKMGLLKKYIADDIELSEILMASRLKKSPLTIHLMLKKALKKTVPEELKVLIHDYIGG